MREEHTGSTSRGPAQHAPPSPARARVLDVAPGRPGRPTPAQPAPPGSRAKPRSRGESCHRKAGFTHIEQAVADFFSFDLAAMARFLSVAELALRGVPAAAVPSLPAAIEVRLPKLAAGGHVLHWRAFAGNRVLLTRQQPISVVSDAFEKVERLAAGAKSAATRGVDTETLRVLAGMLQSMRPSRRQKTPLPGAAILAEAEALAAAVASGKPSDQLARPGQHWIAVPLPTRPQVARIAIPTVAKPDEPAFPWSSPCTAQVAPRTCSSTPTATASSRRRASSAVGS